MFTGGYHLNEEFFEDPLKFKPERFINDQGQFVPHEVVNFFSVGKRRCPGENLARAEVTSIYELFKLIQIYY